LTAPEAPAANAASNVTTSSFTAHWSSASGASGYRLDVSTSNTFGSYVTGYQNLNVGNITNFNVSGLSPNTTYYYRVRVYNNSATSSNSNTIAVLTAPAAPAANAASTVTTSSFTANWNGVSGANGYRLDVSTSNTFNSYVTGYQDVDVGNTTSRNVTGLSAGGTYYYRVRAYNNGATSASSNVISLTLVPAAPIATTASGVTSRWFSANWNSSTGASGYRLDVARNSSFTDYVHGYQDRDVGNVTSFSVKGLSANTTYYYRVRAYNGNGLTGNSNVISVLTTIPPNPTPRPSATPK
jgi:phosphodiesterase/alkaline phosphatase D-like protein